MRHIVILTGAGISAESGLRTFRDADGLWEGSRVEDVATPEAFARDPELVQRFYNARRRQLATVEPNAAHLALASLGDAGGFEVTVITQNVDDLHERSGQKRTLHMHGELLRKKCGACSRTSPCRTDLRPSDVCEDCQRKGTLRPDIVWFGEIPYFMPEIGELVSSADLFIAIGTSGHVYPAAGLADMARAHGARTIEVNREPTLVSRDFDEKRSGPATVVVPALVEEILA